MSGSSHRCRPLLCETTARRGWGVLVFCVGLWVVGDPGFITPCALLQQLLSQQRGKEISGPARNVPGARSSQQILPAQVII